jgi:hypothetical protein
MAVTANQVNFDTPAAEFRLPATDGKIYALNDVAGEKGTVVAFICNHCPYVQAIIDRMGCGRTGTYVGGSWFCGDLLERCGEPSRRFI